MKIIEEFNGAFEPTVSENATKFLASAAEKGVVKWVNQE